MSIRKRIVKNKRKANGLPSGKEGIVFDVYLKYKDSGQFKSYCRRGFLTENEAAKHERFMQNEFIERVQKKDGYQRLDEYLRQWLENGQAVDRWKLNTFWGYGRNIRKYILPVCGHKLLKEITPAICDQILQRMKFQGLSDSSLHYVRQTLSAALNDACSYSYIQSNPVNHTITRLKSMSQPLPNISMSNPTKKNQQSAPTMWQSSKSKIDKCKIRKLLSDIGLAAD